MRKHFLILMLLTLLPLAGWAQTATLGKVAVGEYTYGQTELPVPVVKDVEGSILEDGVHYEVSGTAYKEEACTNSVAKTEMKGNTTYYLKITGIGAYIGQTKVVHFTCKKKALKITVKTAFNRDYLSAVEPTITWPGDCEFDAFATSGGFADTYESLGGELTYTYAGKGNKDYPGGEYDITFSGLTSDCYEISYTAKKFKINGTDISGETVTIKDGTAFADQTYKGAKFVAADLTGLVLKYDSKELVQGTDFDILLNDADVPGTPAVYYTNNQLKAVVTAVDDLNGTDELGADNAAAINAVQGTAYTAETLKSDAEGYATFKTTVDALGASDDATTYVKTPAVPASTFYLNVGTYNYDVKFKGNYSGTIAPFGTFKIVQAPLSVDVENITVTYKSAAYTNDFGTSPVNLKYYGFVGADVENKAALITDFTQQPSVAVKTGVTATDANTEGYALTVSGGNTGAGSNYKIVNYLNTGKLIINKKDVTITSDDINKAAGAADPDFTFTADGLLGTHKVVDVTFNREEGNTVGESYAITPVITNAKVKSKDGKDDYTKNYNLKVGTPNGKLTITKAKLTVTILDQYKYYGDEDPATIAVPVENTNYIVTGLVDGDEITSVTLTKSWAAETVGNYILNAEVTYTGAAHYESFNVVPGNFEIKKAPLTVTLPIKNVAKGATIAATPVPSKDGIVITGFKKGETATAQYDLTLNPGLAVDGESKLVDQANNEGYILTLKATAFANYAIIVGETESQTISGKLIVGTGNTTVLELAANADMFNNIKGANGETRDVEIVLHRDQTIGGKARGWKKGIWNCMVLPFETSARQISSALGYAIVNVVDPANTTENNVKFKLEMLNKIPANTPFFVKSDADLADNYVARFDDVTIDAPKTAYPSVKASSDEIGYNFVGAYDTYTIDGDNKEHLRFRLGSVDAWNKIGNGSSATWEIVPFNAYMDLGATVGAREIIFTFEELDGTATAIRSINVENVDSAEGNVKGWYNLNGVKMQNAPAQKGIYIHNGKKYVVK